MRRLLPLLALVVASTPLAAQDSTVTTPYPGTKAEAIDQVIDAMSKAGLVVVQVSVGGLVVGEADRISYYAAIRGPGPVTITWSARLALFTAGYADLPPARVTSTRKEKGAWDRLVALSHAVAGP